MKNKLENIWTYTQTCVYLYKLNVELKKQTMKTTAVVIGTILILAIGIKFICEVAMYNPQIF